MKATVDAFHGTVRVLPVDEADPIALTLKNAFPDLFMPLAEMPEDMRTRLRYPEGIFALQAAVYARYHMTNPSVFYNKEDLLEMQAIDGDAQPQLSSRITRSCGCLASAGGVHPDAPVHARSQGQPGIVDGGAQRRRALRSHDGSYQFPKQKVVFGPRQIVARISQDQVDLAANHPLEPAGLGGPAGHLLDHPDRESLLYVRPLYLGSAGGRIPESKRVIVAHQNQIVMEETLDAALDRMFPKGGGPSAPAPTAPAGAPPSPLTPSPESSDGVVLTRAGKLPAGDPGAA